ncbi:hypothetical protein [Thiomicrorhabdus sediminis]|uniref:hypothetical protein n=1 Tax=Thiomicrorhabdus sediminis TaxID=2580412 RepID=UPI00143D12AA|nr:hypothetical protein [Thiomicrorhabdus sediminis]
MINTSSLLLIPDGDFEANDIFGIAVSYANTAQIIQNNIEHMNDPRYLFPAMTCASFSLELLVKFFVFKSTKTEKMWNEKCMDISSIYYGKR